MYPNNYQQLSSLVKDKGLNPPKGIRRLLKWGLFFVALLLNQQLMAQVSGTVFRDFNINGTQQTTNPIEPGLEGVTVKAFNASNVQVGATATTNASGAYTIAGITGDVRLEFTLPNTFYASNGKTGNTTVRFATAPTTGINLAANNPSDYCPGTPDVIVTCFVNGNPTLGGTAASGKALVKFPYSIANASTTAPTGLANADDVGSVWGAAYQRETDKVFTAAFLKRHVGLLSAGLGGIFTTQLGTTPTTSLLVDLETFNGAPHNIDLGQSVIGTRSTLPAASNQSSEDASAFGAVGKVGLGGMTISEDGRTLYVINLYQKKLISINIGVPAKTTITAADINTYTIPDPGCTNGESRPFAVRYYQGKVYVGTICSAESSGGTQNNLQAYVYTFDPSTTTFNTTAVANFSLNYPKGKVHTSETPAKWLPWSDNFADMYFGTTNNPPFPRTMRPQPILSDIDFVENGDMVLGFIDRAGHQLGYRNRGVGSSYNGNTYSGYIGGDILRLAKGSGTWTLESGGNVSGLTGSANSQGPGGGEFYSDEQYTGELVIGSGVLEEIHQETYVGSSFTVPGSGVVLATVMDPLSTWSGGTSWFSNTTGKASKRYQIFSTTSDGGVTFGKAAGLGALELTCDASPIEIGNRIWLDTNKNGIQDPGENGVGGVVVTLCDSTGTTITTVTTDNNGNYYFTSLTGTDAAGIKYGVALKPFTKYRLKIPSTSGSNVLTGTDALGNDLADNDFALNGANGELTLITGGSGANMHTYDGGYQPAVGSLGNFIWKDVNDNGKQDSGELGVAGVIVQLVQGATVVATDTTDASGIYGFNNLSAGNYQVKILVTSLPAGCVISSKKDAAGVADTLDSDFDPTTGLSQSVTITPTGSGIAKDNPTIDGALYSPLGSIGNYVWKDTNNDGKQDPTEAGQAGIIVQLLQGSSVIDEDTTDANGFYSFNNLTSDTYQVKLLLTSLPAGCVISSKPNAAGVADTLDSDFNAAGLSHLITIDTSKPAADTSRNNPHVDAALYSPKGSIGDYVWKDLNNNGIQDDGATGVKDVIVELYKGSTTGSPIAKDTTDASGAYGFTNLDAGDYYVKVVISSLPVGCVISTKQDLGGDDTKDSDVSPVTGFSAKITLDPTLTGLSKDNPTIDAALYSPKGSIGDYVWKDQNDNGVQDSGEPAVAGVIVQLLNSTTSAVLATDTTDANGLYLFSDLSSGTYQVKIVTTSLPAGCVISNQQNLGGDDTKDSDFNPTTGLSQVVTIDALGTGIAKDNPTVDAALYSPKGSIGDYVWKDQNDNGIQDASEVGVAGVIVQLLNSTTSAVLATDTTNAQGLYLFSDLSSGTYQVKIVTTSLPADCALSSQQDLGGDDEKDSDFNPTTGLSQVVTIDALGTGTAKDNLTVDAALYSLRGSIGDFVWKDQNDNGIQDPNESPVADVIVQLLQGATVIATDTTNFNGLYLFPNLPNGTYQVKIVTTSLPDSCVISSKQDLGGDDTKDSDFNPTTGLSPLITINVAGTGIAKDNPTIDAALSTPKGSIGDYVWKDQNNNGVQDSGEPAVAGVIVQLLNATTSAVLATDTTNAQGLYLFPNLKSGTYQVKIVTTSLPAGCVISSQQDLGGDDTKDSDFNPTTGLSQVVTINALGTGIAKDNPTVDAALYSPKGSIGDYVWKDQNNNGVQDSGEPAVAGVIVQLLNSATSAVLATDTTNAQGLYLFSNLESGTYQVKIVTTSLPVGCVISSQQNLGGDDTKDSDFNPTTGLSQVVTINALGTGIAKDNPTVDGALVVPCVESSVTLTGPPACSADVQTYSITFTVTNKLGIVKVNKGTLSGNNPYTVTGIPSGASLIITDSLSAICKSDTTIVGPNCNCNPPVPVLLTPSMAACIGDTFPTLKATVVGLATVEWFSQQTGGTVLFTGLNYKPSGTVTGTTTYYAQARSTDQTCPTAVSTSRVPATINAQTCIDTVDLALKKSINTKIAQVGDVLTYTLKVWNESNKNATGVEVADSIATTVQFIAGSFVASRGSATVSGNVIKWTIGNIAANGDTVTLRYQVRATQEGLHFNTAEISKVDQKDVDSTPGNGNPTEDDIDRQCFSVPFKVCPTNQVEASVPASLTNVQWFKDGGTTPVATGNVVLFSEVGIYTFTATNQTCPAEGCCPIIIEPGVNCCPEDLCVPFTIQKRKKK